MRRDTFVHTLTSLGIVKTLEELFNVEHVVDLHNLELLVRVEISHQFGFECACRESILDILCLFKPFLLDLCFLFLRSLFVRHGRVGLGLLGRSRILLVLGVLFGLKGILDLFDLFLLLEFSIALEKLAVRGICESTITVFVFAVVLHSLPSHSKDRNGF